VDRIKNIFLSAYFFACMVAVVYVPLFLLHGYHHWWLIALYAVMAVTAAAGSINHYRAERRNTENAPVLGVRGSAERRDRPPTRDEPTTLTPIDP
jgi:type VI protein secretion system component VasK